MVKKYQNNILDAKGAHDWFRGLRLKGINTVVIGGCTTTSCVRVSAIEVQKQFKSDLQVYVDLNICGARTSNEIKRCSECIQQYLNQDGDYDNDCKKCTSAEDKMSPVDLAVNDMKDKGVMVVNAFDWLH